MHKMLGMGARDIPLFSHLGALFIDVCWQISEDG